MYPELNVFAWRWIVLAGFIALYALSTAFVAAGRRVHERALEQRRADRARRRSAPAHAAPAGP